MFGLSTVVTWCLSDPDVGEESTLKGQWGGASVSDTLVAVSAMEAWWAAAHCSGYGRLSLLRHD